MLGGGCVCVGVCVLGKCIYVLVCVCVSYVCMCVLGMDVGGRKAPTLTCVGKPERFLVP